MYVVMYSKQRPFRVLIFGYLCFILAGTFLLKLPVASETGLSQGIVDAFFTAVSAVTTTGLIVVDTPGYYSFFGESVILVLIQVCGLGYMVFVSMILIGIGRADLGNMILIKESVNSPSYENALKFIKITLVFTVVFEFVAALCFFFLWMGSLGAGPAAYHAVFHSVSGFCTAGFSTFSDSLTRFSGNRLTVYIMAALCIAGGIGFFVIYDIYSGFKRRATGEKNVYLKPHTKLVLITTFLIISAAFIVVFVAGGAGGATAGQKTANSLFQVISASTTTGYNTIEVKDMTTTGIFTLGVLMFIGAAPGSTGSGIKVISVALLAVLFYSVIKGRKNIVIFKRKIKDEKIRIVAALCFGAAFWVMAASGAMAYTEKADFLNVLFEVMSAFGNAGLSTGITPLLTDAGKIIISITMLFGRLGPLVLGYSLVGSQKTEMAEYPESDIIIG